MICTQMQLCEDNNKFLKIYILKYFYTLTKNCKRSYTLFNKNAE